jgi:hypothetical protein
MDAYHPRAQPASAVDFTGFSIDDQIPLVENAFVCCNSRKVNPSDLQN